ncbi:MAG: hypothetical protein GX295_00820 [Syntrophomonadaceae bacterium]|nr:hypothetical protein [Syntrophomonadaceae bacterium]
MAYRWLTALGLGLTLVVLVWHKEVPPEPTFQPIELFSERDLPPAAVLDLSPVEVVDRLYQAVNNHDWPALATLCYPQILNQPGGLGSLLYWKNTKEKIPQKNLASLVVKDIFIDKMQGQARICVKVEWAVDQKTIEEEYITLHLRTTERGWQVIKLEKHPAVELVDYFYQALAKGCKTRFLRATPAELMGHGRANLRATDARCGSHPAF